MRTAGSRAFDWRTHALRAPAENLPRHTFRLRLVPQVPQLGARVKTAINSANSASRRARSKACHSEDNGGISGVRLPPSIGRAFE
jgi:hypothetical protein